VSGVLQLEPTRVPDVVDVLHESFFDYPVMRYVLGECADYDGDLRTLVHFFVMARVFRGEVLLGVSSDAHERLVGAALVSRPGGADAPSELLRLRDEVWAKLGTDARDRYGAFSAACAPFQVATPHLHLNMIGVRRVAKGTGVGRRLIDSVHELSRTDLRSAGVSLTTEDPANVALYRHCGYEVVGEALVAPGLTTWGFFRPD